MAEEFLSISGKIITYSGRVISMRNRTTSGNPVEIVLDDGSRYATSIGNYVYYGENQYVGFHFEGDLEDIWEIFANDTFYWLIGNQSLPNLRVVYLGTGSKSEGDIANLADSIESLTLIADTVVSGDIGDAPSGLTSMNIQGQNTVSGNIGDLPEGLTSMNIQGQNTVSGDIVNLPSGLTSMNIQGQNTVSGDFPKNSLLTYIRIDGNNTITFLEDTTFAENQNYHRIRNASFTSKMVDDYLIRLSEVSNWTGSKTVDLRTSPSAPRTAASNAAVAILQGKGVTVTTY